MSTIAAKLRELDEIRKELFVATREKGVDTQGVPFEKLHERWGEIIPYQRKTALPGEEDRILTADGDYPALGRVTVPPAPELKAENIRRGITIFGVTGTMAVAPTAEVPEDFRSADPQNPDPGSLEEALAIYREHYGEFDGDMFLLVDDEDRRCFGFMMPERESGQKLYANHLLVPAFEELWDAETYPYAFLQASYYSGYDPCAWRVQLEMLSYGSGYSVKNDYKDGYPGGYENWYRVSFRNPKWKRYELVGDTWELTGEGNGAGTTINISNTSVMWASHSYRSGETEVISAGGEGVPCTDFVIPVYDAQTTVFQPIGLRVLVFNAGKYGKYQQGSWWRFDFTRVRTDVLSGTLRLGFDLRTCQILSCGRTLHCNGEEIWPRNSGGEVSA